MGGTTIKSRLEAVDLARPRIDAFGIEAGLREHLARLGGPGARITVVPDAEAGFREVARMVGRGWDGASPAGRRWTYRTRANFASFALWEDRPYFKTGRHFEAAEARPRGHVGGEAERLALAEPSAGEHRRRPGRPRCWPRGVALRALWDEYDAAEVTPEPPRHGQWDRDFRKREKDAYWEPLGQAARVGRPAEP